MFCYFDYITVCKNLMEFFIFRCEVTLVNWSKRTSNGSYKVYNHVSLKIHKENFANFHFLIYFEMFYMLFYNLLFLT